MIQKILKYLSKYISKYILCFALLAGLFSNTGIMLALENIRATKMSDNLKTLDYDINFISSKKEDVNVSFNLQYLSKDAKDNVKNEVFNYGKVSLVKGENIIKTNYSVPEYLKTGEYVLYFSTKDNVSGSIIDAYNYVGKIKLENTSKIEKLEIKECNILNTKSEKVSLVSAPSFEKDAKVSVVCNVASEYKQDVYFKTYVFKKSFSGEILKSTQGIVKVVKDKLTFNVPSDLDPQSYVFIISMQDKDGKKIANDVAGKLIIQGESATIDKLSLSQESKSITADIYGPADFYSRGIESKDIKNYTYELIVKDMQGNVCQSERKEIIFGEKSSYKLTNIIDTKSCDLDIYDISLIVKGADGKVLSQKNIEIDAVKDLNKNYIYIGISVLVLGFLSLIFTVVGKSKTKTNLAAFVLIGSILAGNLTTFAVSLNMSRSINCVRNVSCSAPSFGYNINKFFLSGPSSAGASIGLSSSYVGSSFFVSYINNCDETDAPNNVGCVPQPVLSFSTNDGQNESKDLNTLDPVTSTGWAFLINNPNSFTSASINYFVASHPSKEYENRPLQNEYSTHNVTDNFVITNPVATAPVVNIRFQ